MRRDDVEHALDALASEVPEPAADAASLMARGRRRVIRRRVAFAGIAVMVIATAASIGAATRSDQTRTVVSPAPTTTTTPAAVGPAQQIAVASSLEAWKCLDPMQYTNDGGRSWRAIDIPTKTQPASAEAMTCAVVTGGNAWAMWPSSTFRDRYVLRIRDFTDVRVFRFPQISGDEYLSAPMFVDADHGWVQSHVGDAPVALYRTVDGGETWSIATRNQRLSALEFTSANEGWSLYGDELSTTSDGGASWRTLALPAADVPPGERIDGFGVSVHGDSIVVWRAVSVEVSDNGPHDTLFDVSADRGRTWTRREGPKEFEGPSYNSFNVTDGSHWQLAQGRALRITDDVGRTWKSRPDVPGPVNVQSMSFPTPDVGWINTGGFGSILRTTDAGRTWTDVTDGAAPRPPATTPPTTAAPVQQVPIQLAFASPTEGWICGDPFVYTTDDFETVGKNVKIPAPASAGPRDYHQEPICTALPGGNVWLLRGSGDPDQPELVRIASGGADMQVFPFARISRSTVESIAFVDAGDGWALVVRQPSAQRDLYRTYNGGVTWSLLLRDAPVHGQLKFASAQRGWASSRLEPKVATTTDGGRTWRAVDVPYATEGRPRDRTGVFPALVKGDVIVAYGRTSAGNLALPFVDVSADGGETWSLHPGPKDVEVPVTPPSAFSAADADHWALALFNNLYVTHDGGRTWTQAAEFAGVASISSLAFLTRDIGFVSAVGASPNTASSVVLGTTDGGDTWTTIYSSAPPMPDDATVVNIPGGIIGCPTRPLTPAEPGNPPPGLIEAAFANIRSVRPWEPDGVSQVYRVGTSAGSFGDLFTFHVGSCGREVADASWVVELHGVPNSGGGGSTPRAEVALAHYADGWHVFGRYH